MRIGDGSNKRHSAETVGAKAANLAHMAALGLPVPPAFVLPIKLCAAIADGEAQAKRHVAAGLREGIAFLEQTTGKTFGNRRNPLLVSVRSGAARSMPGMLDTVIDVGCTRRRCTASRACRQSALCLGLPAPLPRKPCPCRARLEACITRRQPGANRRQRRRGQ